MRQVQPGESIKPGTYKIYHGPDYLNNARIHIRAIIDDYVTVYCIWSANKQTWRYVAEPLYLLELYVAQGALYFISGKTNRTIE